jgi:hypothetical protein
LAVLIKFGNEKHSSKTNYFSLWLDGDLMPFVLSINLGLMPLAFKRKINFVLLSLMVVVFFSFNNSTMSQSWAL